MVRQARTLAALQCDMAAMLPVLEPVDDVGQSGSCFGKIGRVDLCDISQADDLGAGTGTGNQCLHLLRGQVLGRESGISRSESGGRLEYGAVVLDRFRGLVDGGQGRAPRWVNRGALASRRLV